MTDTLAPPSISCLRLVPHLPHTNTGPEIRKNNNSCHSLDTWWEPDCGLSVFLV